MQMGLLTRHFKGLLFLGILIISLGCASLENKAAAEEDPRSLDYYTQSWKFDDSNAADHKWADQKNHTPIHQPPSNQSPSGKTPTGWEPPPISDPEPINGINHLPPSDEAITFPDPIQNPQVLEVSLQYKPDAAHYLDRAISLFELDTERSPNNAEINAMALQAFSTATNLHPLTQWGLQGSIHPWVIQPQTTLTNHTSEPWLDVEVTVILDIKWGDLRVDSQLYLTDLNYLRQSAQWVEASRTVLPITILPPDDSAKVTLKPIEILPLITPKVADSVNGLNRHWPESIRIRAWLTPAQDNVEPERHLEEQTLQLLPDYFMTPFHPLRGVL
jgi:hypothetical protein